MSKKKPITSVPDALKMYADYVDPQMIKAMTPSPVAVEFLSGSRPHVKLTRRERLVCEINYRVDRIREGIALKIAPWLEDGE